jgi:hypothetical protein
LPLVVPSQSIVQSVHSLYSVGTDSALNRILMCKFRKEKSLIVAKMQTRSGDFADVLERFLAHASISDLYQANAPHLPADKEDRKYGAETIS